MYTSHVNKKLPTYLSMLTVVTILMFLIMLQHVLIDLHSCKFGCFLFSATMFNNVLHIQII